MSTAGLSVHGGSTVPAMTLLFLAPLGASEWPDDPAARRALATALRSLPDLAPWRELVAWAFARCHDDARNGAPVDAVCTLLGVPRSTLFRWRTEDAAIAALPSARLKRAPGPVVLKGDTRAARASRKGRPRGRRPNPPEVEPLEPPAWAPDDDGAALASRSAYAPDASPRAEETARSMVAAYDGSTTDATGLRAALVVLAAAALTPGEESAALRALAAARFAG